MISTLKNLELVMWEQTDLPESVRTTDENGKTVFKKTGAKIGKTTYTFRSPEGDKLVLLGENTYRNLERKRVDVDVNIVYDDFNRKTKVSLNQVVLADQK